MRSRLPASYLWLALLLNRSAPALAEIPGRTRTRSYDPGVLVVTFKKLRPDVSIPVRAHPDDAGLDLRCAEAFTLAPGERKNVGTGLAVAFASGHAALVLPRSGLAAKLGVTVINSPGLVDAGYRGEIGIPLVNHSTDLFSAAAGERIAQLVLIALPAVQILEASELDETVRGAGGFGSSGSH